MGQTWVQLSSTHWGTCIQTSFLLGVEMGCWVWKAICKGSILKSFSLGIHEVLEELGRRTRHAKRLGFLLLCSNCEACKVSVGNILFEFASYDFQRQNCLRLFETSSCGYAWRLLRSRVCNKDAFCAGEANGECGHGIMEQVIIFICSELGSIWPTSYVEYEVGQTEPRPECGVINTEAHTKHLQ